MDLLDRYVSAVKTYLPADQQDDIGKELSANIQSEMDERPSRRRSSSSTAIRWSWRGATGRARAAWSSDGN